MSETTTSPSQFDRVSEDGRYGLLGHTLYFIAGFGPGEDLTDCPVGDLFDPENFEVAVDAAEEEMRVLRADAAAEFGF
jgi:hypothetical protein